MHGADFYILCVHCVKSGKATGILNFYTLVACKLYCEKAIEQDPDNPDAYQVMANFLLSEQKNEVGFLYIRWNGTPYIKRLYYS